jgi:hypothetical protein
MSFRKRVRDMVIEVLIATVLASIFVSYILAAPKGATIDWRPIGRPGQCWMGAFDRFTNSLGKPPATRRRVAREPSCPRNNC